MARERSSRVPLADSVYQTLFDQFLDGTRAAGEPLNIAVLSDELEVSQTPIREALARLEHTGLVRREPLKGYRVAPLLTEAELIQLMDARVLLEPALTTEAGKRVTPDFLQELLDTIVALDKASQSPSFARSFPKYWSADERFHVLIAQQSGNTFLATAYAALGVTFSGSGSLPNWARGTRSMPLPNTGESTMPSPVVIRISPPCACASMSSTPARGP